MFPNINTTDCAEMFTSTDAYPPKATFCVDSLVSNGLLPLLCTDCIAATENDDVRDSMTTTVDDLENDINSVKN